MNWSCIEQSDHEWMVHKFVFTAAAVAGLVVCAER